MMDIIKLWKKLGVISVEFVFECGGDSMGETSITINAGEKKLKKEEIEEIETYFDDAVYKNVEFYVNSDGHYNGEAGTVTITLNEEGDDFDYNKDAREEYDTTVPDDVWVELTDEETELVTKKIHNFNGSTDSECTPIFKNDCFLSDEDETLLFKLGLKISDAVETHTPEVELDDYEIRDNSSFSTNEEGGLEMDGNRLLVKGSYRVTEYRGGN